MDKLIDDPHSDIGFEQPMLDFNNTMDNIIEESKKGKFIDQTKLLEEYKQSVNTLYYRRFLDSLNNIIVVIEMLDEIKDEIETFKKSNTIE